MLTPVPLLIIPFALYNIIVFLTPGLEWTSVLLQFTLHSGALWQITTAEAFLAFTLLFLLFEILKSARVNSRSFIDHSLSALILLVALAEFLMVPQAATSTFALMLCIMLLDVVAGITASMRAPRRVKAAKPAPAPAPAQAPAAATAPATPPPATPVPAAPTPVAPAPVVPASPPPAEPATVIPPVTATSETVVAEKVSEPEAARKEEPKA